MRGSSPPRLILEIDIDQRVAVGVTDDVAVLPELRVRIIDVPRRREAAGLARSAQIGKDLPLGGGERTSGHGRAGALFLRSGVSP